MGWLEAFEFHGVNFVQYPDEAEGRTQAMGACPFCDKVEHFFLEPVAGLWDCKRCGRSGNGPQFLTAWQDKWFSTTAEDDYERVSVARRKAASRNAYRWAGMAYNPDQKLWLLPTGGTGRDYSLRVWPEERGKLLSTKGLPSRLWGAQWLGEGAEHLASWRVWLCEGEWDGIALGWLFHRLRVKEIAVAVPGATVLKREWLGYFQERDVVLVYDADGAGDNAMLTKGRMLQPVVKSLRYVRWPSDDSIQDGYDISDFLVERRDQSADETWRQLQGLISSRPRGERGASSSNGKAPKASSAAVDTERPRLRIVGAKDEDEPEKAPPEDTEGANYEDVLRVYRKWLDMSPDSEMALRVMLAIVLSNQTTGDPLWMYLVSPPGGGKTALLNPLRNVPQHCLFRSNLTMHTLVSGWQGNSDPSLLPKLNGRTLVLKDMTEILASPEYVQREIFGTLRGAYDGHVERTYGNNVYRHYETRFSLIAGVTVQIHGLQQASMGERMLKFQMMRTAESEESLVRRAMLGLGQEMDAEKELSAVVGSFLTRKIENQGRELIDRVPEWARERIVALAQLIARVRANVERNFRGDQVLFRPSPEVGTRLAKQLLMLGALLIETSENREFTGKEWQIIERVAFDTAIGWNLDVLQVLMGGGRVARIDVIRSGGAGGGERMSRTMLAERSELPRENIERRLADMLLMGLIIEQLDVSSRTLYYDAAPQIKVLWKKACIQDDHVKRLVTIRKDKLFRVRRTIKRPSGLVNADVHHSEEAEE